MQVNLLPRLANSRPVKKYITWAVGNPETAGKTAQEIENGMKNYSKLQELFPDLFMTYIIAYQCILLNKSKDIPKKRKMPLIWANIYSGSMALLIGSAIRKPQKRFAEQLAQRAEQLYGGENKEILSNGIKNAIPILSSAIFFQYVGPVIATPLSVKTSEYFAKKGSKHASVDGDKFTKSTK